MRGVVLQPFPWSRDGIHVEDLTIGDVREFQPGIFGGLERGGFIAGCDESGKPLQARQAVDAAGGVAITTVSKGASDSPGDLTVRHIGAGRYAVFRDEDRLTLEPLSKEDAATVADKLAEQGAASAASDEADQQQR